MYLNIPKDYYQTYRFINPTETAKPDQSTKEIIIDNGTINGSEWSPLDRSFEVGNWWYLVFYPLNGSYDKDPAWYHQFGLDKCRKWAAKHSKTFYVTKEIKAEREHLNLLIHSTKDLSIFHKKHCYSKYKYRIDVSPYLQTRLDRETVFSYMNKERRTRTFKLYADYYGTK